MSYDTARPYLACFVLLKKANKAAFLLRSNTDWMNHHYGIPSGKVEKGESELQAAVREAKEEAGVTIDPADLRFVHACHRKADDDTNSWIDIWFVAEAWSGEAYNAEPHVHSELVWFDLDNLPENVIPSQRFQLQQLVDGSLYSEYDWQAKK